MRLENVSPDDIKPGGWETNTNPQPDLTTAEALYEHIQGGAIDAFDSTGWDVVHCRVMRQLLDRAAGHHKNGVLLIGEPFDASDFHRLLCKHPFALPTWKSKREGTTETLPSIPGLTWI